MAKERDHEREAALRWLALRETFLWTEQSHDGTRVKLLTIHITFNEGVLVGVEFL
jgi:hypothetical protein